MAVAELAGGIYRLSAPEPVGETASLLSRLRRRAQGGQFIVGFDFPIGVPVAYAERAGIESFVAELPKFGSGRWAHFYQLAESKSDISLWRPFYPYRPGGKRQQDLVDALGVRSMKDLLRVCERGDGRADACCLFWTLGANQVGRAAIAGWREVLVPALAQSGRRVAIWPFHGELHALLESSECVIVETYPAEACLHIGLAPPGVGWRKGRQADRKLQGERLLDEWAPACPEVSISPALDDAIRDGFYPDKWGEDRFDAVVGLMSMLDVLTGHRSDDAPQPSAAPKVEGWTFGQQGSPATFASVAEGDRDPDPVAQSLPENGATPNGTYMTRERLLATAGEAAPVIEVFLALEGEAGICLLPKERCLSMRVEVDGDRVPMLNIFARGVHFSPRCPCLYIDGNVLREWGGQQLLDAVRARVASDSLWRLHKVDMQCLLDRVFSEGEIDTLVGFVRWLRDLISQRGSAL